jgi:hypothetical protein
MRWTFRGASSLILLSVALQAHAQVYRCGSGGATYLSDRPCALVPRTQLGAYGPTTPQTYTPYSAPLPDAPRVQDHVKYLGSACASISEAIRTGPTRGVRSDVLRGLQEEYAQKCSVEDQDARRQAQQDKSRELQGKLAERDSALRERQLVKARLDHCDGMRDVIGLKRKREAALNAQEVEALRDLERAYNARCLRP